MKKLKDKVLTALENLPEARNNDIKLMLGIWLNFYPEFIKTDSDGDRTIKLKSLYDLPREDHIKRIRAIIQNEEGKYLPTDPAVRAQRKIAEDKWLEYVRNN